MCQSLSNRMTPSSTRGTSEVTERCGWASILSSVREAVKAVSNPAGEPTVKVDPQPRVHHSSLLDAAVPVRHVCLPTFLLGGAPRPRKVRAFPRSVAMDIPSCNFSRVTLDTLSQHLWIPLD